MHRQDATTEVLTQAVLRYAVERIRMDPPPLDGPRSEAELRAMAGHTITESGIGGLEALRVFGDVLAPACISVDHPAYLSFVPTAPTEAAILFDLVVGASSIYGGSWLEGAGAVFAENEALRWLADLANLPSGTGGVFVAGGSAGNLSGLVAARHVWRSAAPDRERRRAAIVASRSAHSSIASAARVMDADIIGVPVDARACLTGEAVRTVLDDLAPEDAERVVAVVATAGTTNAGIVDDLEGTGTIARQRGYWFHVDAAYGGGALAAPSARSLFDGVELADSLVIDPHKWLFAPFDCAALLYRHPEVPRAAFTQHAEYLDTLTERPEWNPSDYAYHLTRRARGLPFWFSLATHGTRAYAQAVEDTLQLTRAVAELIRVMPHVELVLEPELSVLLFRRIGWGHDEYERWSAQALADGLTLTLPSSWDGETVLRFCFVNPRTTVADVEAILASME